VPQTYAVLFVVVAENRKSSILSELCSLQDYLIINSLLYNDCLCIAWTNLHHHIILSLLDAAAAARAINTNITIAIATAKKVRWDSRCNSQNTA